jgi:hypothetical protein
LVGPEAFAEVRYLLHAKQMQARDAIPEIVAGFDAAFGRPSGWSCAANPETSWHLPWLHSLFGTAPALAAGIACVIRSDAWRSPRLPHGVRRLDGCRAALGDHEAGEVATDDLLGRPPQRRAGGAWGRVAERAGERGGGVELVA